VSEYARNVVALGEMKHQAAELFEPAGRVFGCRAMSLEPQLQGILSERDAPAQLPPHRYFHPGPDRTGMPVEAVPLPRSLPQGEGSQERSELFEPSARVDGCREMSLIPTLNQSAIFVVFLVGFLNVFLIRLRSLLLAVAISSLI